MVTLSTDVPRAWELGDINELPVIADDIIYAGAAVGDNGSGYARPLQAGDPFVGFAEDRADNAGGAAGNKTVRLKTCGLVEVPVTGVTGVAQRGDLVYASDDDTYTLTAMSNSLIGTVHRVVSTGVAVVAFDVWAVDLHLAP